MARPSIDSKIAGAVPMMNAATLDDQLRRAEDAVMRRDERLRQYWKTASVQGRRAVDDGSRWAIGAVALGVAGWWWYRSRTAPQRRAAAAARQRREARFGGAAAPIKTASRWSFVGAAFSLLTALAQAAVTFGRLGIGWRQLTGSSARGASRGGAARASAYTGQEGLFDDEGVDASPAMRDTPRSGGRNGAALPSPDVGADAAITRRQYLS